MKAPTIYDVAFGPTEWIVSKILRVRLLSDDATI